MGMISVNGGVCAASGFMAASAAAGIRKKGREDMALIFSKEPCTVAGTFTSNVVKAAPVQWDKKIVDSGNEVHAVVVNSGIANACTGKAGFEDCQVLARSVAGQFGNVFSEEQVLVASTGVIGMELPIRKMQAAITELVLKLEAGEENATLASKAIMTTDTVNKEFAVEFELSGKKGDKFDLPYGEKIDEAVYGKLKDYDVVVISADALTTKAMCALIEIVGEDGYIVVDGVSAPAAQCFFAWDMPVKRVNGYFERFDYTMEDAARLNLDDITPGTYTFSMEKVEVDSFYNEQERFKNYKSSPYAATQFNNRFNSDWEGKKYNKDEWDPIFRG